ncbi:Pyrimidine 5'-nucleotidase YjjG [hydrothermal vent metagenome]|uniref:Pyrimidine 5'-nucleotidase YjjG n=1 Tax=hydrothermal vent metagenome TaxID=652676 RepID=A0A3B0TKI7_9ZZZZ
MFKGVTDIFFDLDHTLWDFEKNSALTFEKILPENNVSVDVVDFLKVYVPANLAFWKLFREEKITKEALRYQRLKSVFDKLGVEVGDHIIDLLADQYILHLPSFNHLFQGAIEVLEYLKPRYKLHIITNGFQEVQDKKLKNSKIDAFFEHIINSEIAGVKKPDPIIFQLALGNARVNAEKALMIGDNLEADILGAQAVGYRTLHFNAHNEPRHDFCPMIHDLIEIKTFL